MRVSIRERAFETFCSEEHHKSMPFACFNNDLRVAYLLYLLGQQCTEFFADGGIDAPSPAVRHDSLIIQRAEISPRSHIASLELETEAESFNDPAADLKFEWVIAE